MIAKVTTPTARPPLVCQKKAAWTGVVDWIRGLVALGAEDIYFPNLNPEKNMNPDAFVYRRVPEIRGCACAWVVEYKDVDVRMQIVFSGSRAVVILIVTPPLRKHPWAPPSVLARGGCLRKGGCGSRM